MAAEVVFLCRKLSQCIDFFRDTGFRLEAVFPANDPRHASLSGHGIAIRLERAASDGGGHLRIRADRAREVTAPNGTRLEFVTDAAPRPAWQPASLVVAPATDAAWIEGRAGMLYHDVIPPRQDNSLIASRIRIKRGGPVADYVHYHRVDAQVIYCRVGAVRVVYEDQGEPFWLQPGDCVLQAPGIRHRVLECSDELEVIEVSSPAEHETCVEHELELPTATLDPGRRYGGQRFVRHQASGAVLRPWSVAGFDVREAVPAEASDHAVAVRVVRPTRRDVTATLSHDNDRRFWFVLRGSMTLARGAERWQLSANAACVLPPNVEFTLNACSSDLEFLEVARNVRHGG